MELSVEIAVYCWLKNLLKYLASVLKLEINSLLISNGGITGTFVPLAKVFKIDQYVLVLVLGLTNFAAKMFMPICLFTLLAFFFEKYVPSQVLKDFSVENPLH